MAASLKITLWEPVSKAEDPIKLSIRSFLFIFLTFYAKDIVDLLLKISGTPYNWILAEDLPAFKICGF